jgi:hypothetical protein
MSAEALFLVGALVTLIVGSAIGLLVYAAVLDGRRQREVDERRDTGTADVLALAQPDPAHPFDLQAG